VDKGVDGELVFTASDVVGVEVESVDPDRVVEVEGADVAGLVDAVVVAVTVADSSAPLPPHALSTAAVESSKAKRPGRCRTSGAVGYVSGGSGNEAGMVACWQRWRPMRSPGLGRRCADR
jgi:hypothetical protein